MAAWLWLLLCKKLIVSRCCAFVELMEWMSCLCNAWSRGGRGQICGIGALDSVVSCGRPPKPRAWIQFYSICTQQTASEGNETNQVEAETQIWYLVSGTEMTGQLRYTNLQLSTMNILITEDRDSCSDTFSIVPCSVPPFNFHPPITSFQYNPDVEVSS